MSELLSKLAPHAKFPNGEPPGGIPEITAEDVAGACAGMNRQVYLYALAKFVFDLAGINELYRENRRSALYRARLQKWRALELGVGVVEKMADLSLRESLIVDLCGHCNGAGVHNNQKTCRECGGSGKARSMGAVVRARFCGVSVSQWESICTRRYDEMLRELDYFDSMIGAIIRKRLEDTIEA